MYKQPTYILPSVSGNMSIFISYLPTYLGDSLYSTLKQYFTSVSDIISWIET